MNEIKQAIEKALPKIALRLENELKLVCPVDKGFLRWSINVEANGSVLSITMLDYGLYVEFGTFKQRPNPFIRNTIRNKMAQIVQEEILKHL